MGTIVLAELQSYDPTLPGVRTIRLATGPGYNHPSSPGGLYHGHISAEGEGASVVERSIWERWDSWGAGSLSLGALMLANDGSWDWLRANRLRFNRRPARFLVGDQDDAYDDFSLVATGSTALMVPGRSSIEFRWRDAMAEVLEQPVGIDKFAGDNDPGDLTGLQGTADDLKDKWVPDLLGVARNFSPPCANTTIRAYVVSRRAVSGVIVDAVSDKGAALTLGTVRASLALLLANTPAPDTYDVFLGSATEPCVIRLGSEPVGEVTVDAWEDTDNTPGAVWYRFLVSRCGVDADLVSISDALAIDALCPWDVGDWYGPETVERRGAFDLICASAGAVSWMDPDGVWRIKAIAPLDPDGSGDLVFRLPAHPDGVLALGDIKILDWEPIEPDDDSAVPVGSLTVKHSFNHTVQRKDALAGVALDRQGWLERDYRQVERTADIATLYPEPRTGEIETRIDGETGAGLLGDRLIAVLSTELPRHRLTVALSDLVAAGGDLGRSAAVFFPRYELAEGIRGLVVRIEADLSADLARVDVVELPEDEE